jgi:tetratricopeptide (TPR) repeat protein
MTSATLSMLDQAELLQLALNASAAGDSGATIGYLKEAVSRPDGSAAAHYMLGAEYAQIKMYPRAIDEMEAALALDPALSVARLQLGLLWLAGNDSARAAEVFAGLATLSQQDPLYHFGRGLQYLIREQLSDAEDSLLQGIGLNDSNPALNGDMQKVLGEIGILRAAAPPAVSNAAEIGEGERSILLSAYTGNQSH